MLNALATGCKKFHENGTISKDLMLTMNDLDSFRIAVGGHEIFQMIANEVANAEKEVLIQTFVWDRNIEGVTWLKNALIAVADRKKKEIDPEPLKVYIQIDERGIIANYAYTGHRYTNWPLTAESLGLISIENFVEVSVDTYYHDSAATNHAKTITIDRETMIITGANFQSSNFHHQPAHDAAYMIKGNVALATYEDFRYMWMCRKNRHLTPDIRTDIFPKTDQKTLSTSPLKILITSRLPQIMRSLNFMDNPQNYALFELLNGAQKMIKICTPNLNAPFVMGRLIHFINGGGCVKMILGHSFNEKRESTPFMGGTNQYVINELYSQIDPDYEKNLDIRWFSVDGVNPIIGNVAGASHLKFLSVDGHLVMVGNANLDITSTLHAHEINIIMDSDEITRLIEMTVFDDAFERSIPVRPSANSLETFKHSSGLRGMQSLLGQRFPVKVINIVDEGSGMKTYWLSKPDQLVFNPGQYFHVRSGRRLSQIIKKPLQTAISSGTNEKYIKITARPSQLLWHSNHCLHKENNEVIEIEGPLGTFFPINVLCGKKLILIGGGSGITTIRSVIFSLSSDIEWKLFYSAKTYQDLLYKNELSQWTTEGKSTAVISLTQEKSDGFENVRVTEILKSQDIDCETYIFICGPMPLIKDVRNLLKTKNVRLDHMYMSTLMDALHGGPVVRGDHPTFM